MLVTTWGINFPPHQQVKTCSLNTLPQALGSLFTPFTAFVFLTFTLLYTPCVAAIAAVKREMGGAKGALTVVIAQCAIAWVVAFAVRCVGMLFGL